MGFNSEMPKNVTYGPPEIRFPTEPKSYDVGVQFGSLILAFMYTAAGGSSLLDPRAYDNHAQLQDIEIRRRRADTTIDGTPLGESDDKPTVGFDVWLTIKRFKGYLHEQDKIVVFHIRTVKLEKNLVFDFGSYLVAHLSRCGYLVGDPTPEEICNAEEDIVAIKPDKMEAHIWRIVRAAGVGLIVMGHKQSSSTLWETYFKGASLEDITSGALDEQSLRESELNPHHPALSVPLTGIKELPALTIGQALDYDFSYPGFTLTPNDLLDVLNTIRRQYSNHYRHLLRSAERAVASRQDQISRAVTSKELLERFRIKNKPSGLPAKLRSWAEKMFREDQIKREHEFRSLWQENKEKQGSCKQVRVRDRVTLITVLCPNMYI
ncbi:hypothetical protein QFC24_004106 [Naganishia onofrii]|uniref:Uncharacterized protein n=1 Tax=Naganishia onofrii TaxID=1851511 RepID=A0ACC2XFJ1_9TREE|nr:hypothetical protein QFC24_004106 [Naganishia onofrii]